MTSTRDLSAFPDIATLLRRMQSLAMLDAMLSPEWEYRYFSFDSRWANTKAGGEQMGSMRDGNGNHYFAWFGPAGCWIKGFDHESPMSPYARTPPQLPDGVLEGVPREFLPCLREPAFVIDETTFCLWRRAADRTWAHGPVILPDDHADPDGSIALLAPLDGNPHTYAEWAQEHYERDVPLPAVEAIYAHRPLSADIVRSLGGPPMKALRADIDEIGYPADLPQPRR